MSKQSVVKTLAVVDVALSVGQVNTSGPIKIQVDVREFTANWCSDDTWNSADYEWLIDKSWDEYT